LDRRGGAGLPKQVISFHRRNQELQWYFAVKRKKCKNVIDKQEHSLFAKQNDLLQCKVNGYN
jgi:hypothetical protein